MGAASTKEEKNDGGAEEFLSLSTCGCFETGSFLQFRRQMRWQITDTEKLLLSCS